jgi:broad specificity phosphatase PhoE
MLLVASHQLNCYVLLPTYLAEYFNYDINYKSLISNDDINYPENENMLDNRIKTFLNKLIKENYRTNKNILLVTHQGVCKIILNIINKFGNNLKPDIELIDYYPTGKISLVFDNDNWIYKII